MEVESKSQMYNLFDKGAFGNKPITYNTVSEYIESDYEGTVSLRYKDRSSGKSLYGLDKSNIESAIKSGGFNPNAVSISQSPPDSKIIFQGEVCLSTNHYNLTWSRVKKPMKLAFADSINYSVGSVALSLIRTYFNENSFNDLMELFALYPNSVIEFTCYSINLGSVRGRNTLIWEVRNY